VVRELVEQGHDVEGMYLLAKTRKDKKEGWEEGGEGDNRNSPFC
jgi:hypothetical protein